MTKTLASIVGARPQFIKLAPVCRALSALMPEWEHQIIHTGQHYDYGMSDVFFERLKLPPPNINLNTGSGSQGAQTAAMIGSLEDQLTATSPVGVITFGDTNSTLAGTLAACKLHIPVFHIEAGLRSFDRRMPEEVNRIVADHCSELLFAPTETAVRNLQREGLADRSIHVGDVMYDAIVFNASMANGTSEIVENLASEHRSFGVVTIHRASSTDPNTLSVLLRTLEEISNEVIPLIFPIHPRTREAILKSSITINATNNLHIIEPLSYPDMLALLHKSRLVLTDSGGLQKEAVCVGTPCITLRDSTEWMETVAIGANILTGYSKSMILDAVNSVLNGEDIDWSGQIESLYGDGKASERIVAALANWFSENQ